ncbi:MAG: AAA family ATPase, partial [Crenarchaeota archaeon]|nr:AAA family ATPase [Thermoproteota archaeon]
MSICEISIENFKSIVSGRAKLTEGINFIYGPNGAGKSSILDALAYALYGSEWLRRSRLRLADLVRVKSRTAVIRVKVRGIDGKMYTIQRVFTPEKTVEANTYVLDESGRRVASRDKEVTSFVEKILNVSVSVFSELLYVRQGELRSILDSSKRTETKLDKVLKIESLEKLRSDYLKEVRKLAEMHLRRIEGKISIIDEEITKLSKNIQQYREEVKKLENLLEELERKRIELEEKKCSVEKELEEVKQDVDKIRELEVLLKEKERELEKLEEKKRELEEISKEMISLRKRLEELDLFVNEETKLRNRLDKLRESRARLEVELKEIENREKTCERFKVIIERRRQELEKLERELNNIEQLEKDVVQIEEKLRKIEKAKKLLDKFKEEIASLQALKTKLEDEIKLLKDSKGVCPLCGRELSDQDKARLLEEKSQELERLRERISLVEIKIRKYERYVSREEELKERYYRLREIIS